MKKYIVLLVLFICMWEVFYNDTVSNALLALFVGGQVPFSGVVLSPRIVIGMIAALIFIFVFWLLAKFTPKHTPKPLQIERQIVQTPTALLPSEPLASPIVVTNAKPTNQVITAMPAMAASPILYRRHNRLRIRRRFWLAHKISLINDVLQEGWPNVQNSLHHSTVKSRENFSVALGTLRHCWQRLYRSASHVTVKASVHLVNGMKVGWHHAAPLLWRFDAWLEQQAHGMQKSLSDSFHSYSSVNTFLEATRETLDILGLRRPDR